MFTWRPQRITHATLTLWDFCKGRSCHQVRSCSYIGVSLSKPHTYICGEQQFCHEYNYCPMNIIHLIIVLDCPSMLCVCLVYSAGECSVMITSSIISDTYWRALFTTSTLYDSLAHTILSVHCLIMSYITVLHYLIVAPPKEMGWMGYW